MPFTVLKTGHSYKDRAGTVSTIIDEDILEDESIVFFDDTGLTYQANGSLLKSGVKTQLDLIELV